MASDSTVFLMPADICWTLLWLPPLVCGLAWRSRCRPIASAPLFPSTWRLLRALLEPLRGSQPRFPVLTALCISIVLYLLQLQFNAYHVNPCGLTLCRLGKDRHCDCPVQNCILGTQHGAEPHSDATNAWDTGNADPGSRTSWPCGSTIRAPSVKKETQ